MTRAVVRVAPWLIGPSPRGGLTTRRGFPAAGNDDARAALREALATRLGHPPLAWLRQVHGSQVHTVEAEGPAGEGDALVTPHPDLVLLVTVADCCPVLLADPQGPVHAAAHAGWRGLLAGVLEATVATAAAAGAPLHRLRAWIGPSIGPCCFEVGPEVAERFPPEVRHPRPDRERPHVDLRAAAAAALAAAGVRPDRIDTCQDCTSCRQDLYWSYRRDGGICGRHLGFVGGGPG